MKKTDRDSITEYAVSPIIELTGNTFCSVEGIKSINEYSDGKIKLDLGKISVLIFGDGLCISSFSPEGAQIDGTVISMEFESNG